MLGQLLWTAYPTPPSSDPGVKVTCNSWALPTADKGNDPLHLRPFAGVDAGPVAHRLTPYWPDREATGEIDTEDIEVFIVADVRKSKQ